MNYKYGDLIVRCYPDNLNAICIYWNNKVLYLGETFNLYGGLEQFDLYGPGFTNTRWHYRFATHKETTDILIYLMDLRKNNGNIYIHHLGYLDNVIDIINIYKNNTRKEKLERLNGINY